MKRTNDRILLDDHYDSSNASQMAEELFSLVEENEKEVTLDASNLRYISSAGLRVLMKLKKKVPAVKMVNVSRDVYDILEMTGFTDFIQAERALREIDLTNATEIGHGFSSVVYSIDDDTIVKIFHPRIPLSKISREVNFAKKAFLFGIPTMISYDIVKCADRYGTVFELVAPKVLSKFLNDNPDKFEEYTDKYLDLIRESHATEVDESFEDIPALWHTWVDMLSPFLTEKEGKKLHALISAVPERNTFVHSDIHVNNVMIRGDELVLIDMADIGRGHPIFDIAPICFHYNYMELAAPERTDSSIVLTHDNRLRLWEKIKENYLADPDPDKHEALVKIYECFGGIRCGLIAAKQAQMDEELKQKFVDVMRERVFPQADEVLALMKRYMTE